MAQENKTERATPYRRRKLRKEGNVAKSVEIAIASTVLLGSIAIFFTGYTLFSKVLELFWSVSLNPHVDFHRIFIQIKEGIFPLILPFFMLSLLVVVLIHIAQFGFIFTIKALEPKLERLNPFEGLKRIFSMTTLFELTKNLLKVFLLMIVAYFLVKSELWEFLSLFASESSTAIKGFLGFTFKLVIFISVIALFIALLDYAYKRWDYERKIRMSKEELTRALYPVVEVGEEIPPKFYRAVAEVIAFVLSRRRRIAV
jgi:flagellar biosynthetic protein FlhB